MLPHLWLREVILCFHRSSVLLPISRHILRWRFLSSSILLGNGVNAGTEGPGSCISAVNVRKASGGKCEHVVQIRHSADPMGRNKYNSQQRINTKAVLDPSSARSKLPYYPTMKALSFLLFCTTVAVSHAAVDSCTFNWPTMFAANLTQSPIASFSTLGSVETAQTPPTELSQILSQVSPSRINNTIASLVTFGTRSTLSDKVSNTTYGIGGARDWIAKEMRSYVASSGGKLNVSVISYIQQPTSEIPVATNISDVVGILTGSTDPGRIYVISGHYDSRVSDVEDFTQPAPGADDDASGVAVMLEAARLLSALAGQGRGPKATVIFTAVAGEEQGLFGSTFLANTLKSQGADVQGECSLMPLVYLTSLQGCSTMILSDRRQQRQGPLIHFQFDYTLKGHRQPSLQQYPQHVSRMVERTTHQPVN